MTTIGVVDIGSTSVKRLLLGTDGSRDRATVVTRLGRGVDRTGLLSDEAIADTVAAIVQFADDGAARGVVQWRAVATSACRDAANRDDLFDRIETVLGARPTLLSGEAEGQLAFRGAVTGELAHPAVPSLVVDIGGGSTEFMYGVTEPSIVTSIDLGAGRLLERELHHDPPRPEELTNAIGAVIDAVDDVMRDHPVIAQAPRLIGVGGTIRVMAAVEIGRPATSDELHGFELTRAAAEDVFRTLVTEPLRDRIHNPGLPADRAEVIVGGACVLVAVLRKLGAASITVSTGGVMAAVASELLAEVG